MRKLREAGSKRERNEALSGATPPLVHGVPTVLTPPEANDPQLNPPPRARVAQSTLRTLALLANRAACCELLDMIGRERNLARSDQIAIDLADAFGRFDRELVE